MSTKDLAAAFGLSEAEVRAFADDLDAGKAGNAHAWTKEDVEALAAEIDAADGDDVGDEDDEDETEDDNDENDDDTDDEAEERD